MSIILFIIQLLAVIAVIVFIIHTAAIHKQMNNIFSCMNKTIDDISIHLDIIKHTNENLEEVHTKLNICTNGITEIISKQKYINKTIDKVTTNTVEAVAVYTKRIEAKISSIPTQPNNISSDNVK